MASEQEKQNAREGGYTVALVGKGTYDAYVVYHQGAPLPGEFALLESAWMKRSPGDGEINMNINQSFF